MKAALDQQGRSPRTNTPAHFAAVGVSIVFWINALMLGAGGMLSRAEPGDRDRQRP